MHSCVCAGNESSAKCSELQGQGPAIPQVSQKQQQGIFESWLHSLECPVMPLQALERLSRRLGDSTQDLRHHKPLLAQSSFWFPPGVFLLLPPCDCPLLGCCLSQTRFPCISRERLHLSCAVGSWKMCSIKSEALCPNASSLS